MPVNANGLFLAGFAVLLLLLLRWGFKALPRERWQILCSLPKEKDGNGSWRGVNFTYYGLFNANSYALATATVFLLLGSLAVPASAIFAIAAGVLVPCIPASKILARIVEKRRYTFSVGAASFVGILLAPWVIFLARETLGARLGFDLQVVTGLAALAIAYAFGEGMGRLACISFGCCYGKPLSQVHPLLRRLFAGRSFVFTGKTKKIAYAHGLDGERVLPIQAITAVICCGAGLLGLGLFLNGWFRSALLAPLVITQLWRFLSEFLRHDYRGGGKISAYQVMSLAALPYMTAVAFLFPLPPPQAPDILSGLEGLWHPVVIIFLQCLWVGSFLYTGKSQVTGATMSFHVVRDRV
jgi:hypothetical protein